MDKIKEIIDRVFKSEQEKRLMGAAVLVLIGLCIFIMAISPLVGASPIITLNGEEEMQVECGSEFVDPGVKATAKDEDISDLVMTTSNVDTAKLGTYHVEYQLKYKKRKVSKERIVKVIDHTAPVIALNGDATVIVGSFEEYQEAGATAQDGCDGDVSKDIKITKEKVNDYTMQVHYEVTDSHGNTGSMDRQIILKDTSAPEITLNGESSVTVKELEKYEDAGATATDDRDGDITANLVKSGYVDVYRPGTYTVTYTATDSSGNVSQATRTVKVEEVETNPGDSIYLTFDDGPSKYTPRILDSLEANGGRATFFMVGNRVASYASTVKRMADLGCETDSHTWAHTYLTGMSEGEILQSLNQTRDAIVAAGGNAPKGVRPPGGKINDASKAVLAKAGMPSIIWSVDTLDWKTRNAQHTIDTVLRQVQDGDIILMHDLYEQSVIAAETLIPELTRRGYQLVTVSEMAELRGGMAAGQSYGHFR